MSKKQFEEVSCRFGAPMGRSEHFHDFSGKARCFKVSLNSGGYDDGGCYWGFDLANRTSLYCATNGEFRMFTRQFNRKDAKENFEARAKALGQKIVWVN